MDLCLTPLPEGAERLAILISSLIGLYLIVQTALQTVLHAQALHSAHHVQNLSILQMDHVCLLAPLLKLGIVLLKGVSSQLLHH